MASLAQCLPAWHEISACQQSPNWNTSDSSDSGVIFNAILDLVESELESRWLGPFDAISDAAQRIVNSMRGLAEMQGLDNSELILFAGYYLSVRMAELCNSRGRFGPAYDWLLCALGSCLFVKAETGKRLDLSFPKGLPPFAFLDSAAPFISAQAKMELPKWINVLYYYVRRTGGHQDIAQCASGPSLRFILLARQFGNLELLNQVIPAASQLAAWAAWATGAGSPVLKPVVSFLLEVYSNDKLNRAARKEAGISLCTNVGSCAGIDIRALAGKVLNEFSEDFCGHERLQLEVAVASRPPDPEEHYSKILTCVQEYVGSIRAKADSSSFCFGQIRLFDILSPYVLQLANSPAIPSIAPLLGAWFGVPEEQRCKSETAFICPSEVEGLRISFQKKSEIRQRDQNAALRAVTESSNDFLGTCVLISDQPSYAPDTETENQPFANAAEFEESLAQFYEWEELREPWEEVVQAAACMVIHPALPHPVQALQAKQFGNCLPILSSFQQPEPDRPLKRALLVTVGTYTGQYAIEGTANYLRSRGVECDLSSKDLTPEEFKHLYQDERYDAIWIEAHGEFDPATPDLSSIKLSWDGTQAIGAGQLLELGTRHSGRRLLVLNICEGGAAMVFNSPPKMGIAPLLASAQQAVASHLWPTQSTVAPVFGLLLAIGAMELQSFPEAFHFALNSLRFNRENLLELLRSKAPEAVAIIERVENGVDAYTGSGIDVWGSPVFYI